jgi:hypothetical protein
MTRRLFLLSAALAAFGFRRFGWFTIGGQVSRNGYKYTFEALYQMVNQLPGCKVREETHTYEIEPLVSIRGVVTHARMRYGSVQVKVKWFCNVPRGSFLTPSGHGTLNQKHVEDYELSHLAVSKCSALMYARQL